MVLFGYFVVGFFMDGFFRVRVGEGFLTHDNIPNHTGYSVLGADDHRRETSERTPIYFYVQYHLNMMKKILGFVVETI